MADPDIETVDLPGDDTPQGFLSYSDEKDSTPELFDMPALPEGTSIHNISSEETHPFHPKEGQNLVSAIKSRMNLCFSVAKKCSSC